MNFEASANRGANGKLLNLKKKLIRKVVSVCNGKDGCSTALSPSSSVDGGQKDVQDGGDEHVSQSADSFDDEHQPSCSAAEAAPSKGVFCSLIEKLENCRLYAVAEPNCRVTETRRASDAPVDDSQSPVSNRLAEIVPYVDESQMPFIMQLITKDLSEPYSIYTYRYFIHNWPSLCFLARATGGDGQYVGAIVCKLALHPKGTRRGYIAMLAVDKAYRRSGIASELVVKAIATMMQQECDEVVLEAEVTNQAALNLYENLGFIRYKRLLRYYLNGVDAFRLKLWLKSARALYL